MSNTRKRPRDANQLAKLMIDIATGQAQEPDSPEPEKDAAAVSLGRRGGLKGGRARADNLTPRERSEIARAAAAKRWKKE